MDYIDTVEDEDGDIKEYSKESLILLIENSEAMHQDISEKQNAFQMSLKCAWTIIRNQIFNGDQNILSLVLFGNKYRQNSEFENIFVIHELGLPSGKMLMKLEKNIESGCEEFKNDASDNLYNLSDALWACTHLFTNCKNQNYSKRIFVFTNNDMPYGNSKEKKLQLSSRISDLQQNNIEIIVMHINRCNKIFDFNLQFKDLLFNNDEDFSEYPNSSASYEELVSRIQYNNNKKRKLGSVPFIFMDELQMAVSFYKLYHPKHKAPPIKLYKVTNEEVVLNSKYFLKSNLDLLGPQDFKKCQTFLDKKICFDKEEIAEIKVLAEPGFHLIGFLHKSMVKTLNHVQPAKFIYPEESLIKGSTMLFSALLKQMLDSENVAICKFIPNKNHEPNIVALFPQKETIDGHNNQISPPGFHVIYIPFVDDHRQLTIQPNHTKIDKLQIEKAKELVKKLQFSFNCSNFENPVLQKHFLDIEAIVLEKKAPDNFKDFTEPDDEKIENRVGQLVDEFKSLFDEISSQKNNKRKVECESTNNNKSFKFDGSVDEIKKASEDGKLVAFTVPILKEMIKTLKIKNAPSKKADMIAAIIHYFA